MTQKQAHLITVLGRTIPVRSAASETRVREIEQFVHKEVTAIQEHMTSADPQLLVTLALLNLAERYLGCQDSVRTGQEIEQRIIGLVQKLETLDL